MASRLTALLALALAPAAAAQVALAPAAADTTGATVETRLERDRTRLRGDVGVRVVARAGPWAVRAHGRYLADGFGRTSGAYDWREDLVAAVDASRPLRPGVGLDVRALATRVPQSRVTRAEALVGLAYDMGAGLRVAARAGAARDARPGALLSPTAPAVVREDTGPAVGLDVAYADEAPGQALRFDVRAVGALLGARRSGDALGAVSYAVQQDRFRVRTDARVRRARRDAYNAVPFFGPPRPLAEAVEATTSDTLDVLVHADVALAGPLRLALAGAFGRTARRLRTPSVLAGALVFDTDFSRQALDFDGAVLYERAGLAARAGVRTAAAREDRRLVNGAALPLVEAARKADLLAQTNFDRGTLALVAALRWEVGRWFVLADAERSILRFDTPEANADDRDEARLYGRTSVRYRLFDGLDVRAEAVGYDLNTVYLRRARSAESQRQRTLLLRPGLDLVATDRTRWSLGTEVRATYTRDRFTLPGRERADQSAREWRLESTLAHTFAGGPLDGLRLDLDGRLGDLRLGRLLPDRFAEVPFDTLRTRTLSASVTGGTRWRYTVGVQTFRRTDAERALAVPFARADGTAATFTRPGVAVFSQAGPLARLMLPLAGGSEVRIEGWYAAQRTQAVLAGPPPLADADAVRRAATGRWQLQPTLAVAARWRMW